jgi:hypothetical protein
MLALCALFALLANGRTEMAALAFARTVLSASSKLQKGK